RQRVTPDKLANPVPQAERRLVYVRRQLAVTSIEQAAGGVCLEDEIHVAERSALPRNVERGNHLARVVGIGLRITGPDHRQARIEAVLLAMHMPGNLRAGIVAARTAELVRVLHSELVRKLERDRRMVLQRDEVAQAEYRITDSAVGRPLQQGESLAIDGDHGLEIVATDVFTAEAVETEHFVEAFDGGIEEAAAKVVKRQRDITRK